MVVLEATLFFSMSLWEAAAAWGEPASVPLPFAATVLTAATAAMLAFHTGPAFFAATRSTSPVLIRILLLWTGIGLAARIANGYVVASTTGTSMVPVTLAGAAILAIALRSWWKPAALVLLAIGGVLLAWALASTWRGIGATNPQYGSVPVQYESRILLGTLVAASPAIVLAWRIGKIASNPRAIWWSGFAGVWLPIAVSLGAASVATEAGAALYWVPSLPRGFSWALLGPDGHSLHAAWMWARWTLASPVLVSLVSLRLLHEEWNGRKVSYGALLLGASLIYIGASRLWGSNEVRTVFEEAADVLWAQSMLALGAVAALIALRCRLR